MRFDKFAGSEVSVFDEFSILLNANAGVACHTLEKRVVSPSFREVAAKYAGDGDAAGKLAKKVKESGAGDWGNVPMPAHPAISESDLQRVVAWILQQK